MDSRTMEKREDRLAREAVNLMNPEEKRGLLQMMMRIRCFEQVAMRKYQTCTMGGFLTLDIGQESIPAMTRCVMKPGDHSLTGHRAMGHFLAAGGSPGRCMAELTGKQAGCHHGKGGCQSLSHPAGNFWGGFSVAGSQTPVAAGLAFAEKYRDSGGVVFCFPGDGAVNPGVFHESMNLAALFELPVIYVIENNGFAMGTSVRRSSAFRRSLARRAERYGMEWLRANSWEIYDLRAALCGAAERARSASRPTLLEVETCRFYGHTVADANAKKYRAVEEIEFHRRERDPLKCWQSILEDEGLGGPEDWAEMQAAAGDEALGAAEFAKMSEPPGVGDLLRDVYAEVDGGFPGGGVGRLFF